MRGAALLLSMVVAVAAQASALQECRRSEPDGANLVPCLRRAREAATEEMLAAFLDVQRAAEAAAAPEAARAALKQSQRAFERYLSEHCHGAQPAFAAAQAALLACEVDLLRQRAEALQALEIGARGF